MTQTQASPSAPRLLRPVSAGVAVLIGVVLVFAAIRVAHDWPHLIDGTVPDDDFAERYVAHPWFGYLHIAPGVVYLLGATLQLSRRYRTAHYTAHRRLGRVLLGCGLVSGVLALVFGALFAWGGPVESAAAVVFGSWFVFCLVRAFEAIRSGDVRGHRRWMIRAFAVSVGVGTIRLWVGVFTGVLLATSDPSTLPERTTFAIAFWLALSMHVVVGEWWLRRTPELGG